MYHRFEKVKQHIQENKTVYVTSGATFVIGGVAALVFIPRNIQIVDAMNLKLWSPTTSNVTQIIVAPTRRMHPGYIVRCKETGEVAASIRRMASIKNVNLKDLNKHLHGLLPDVDNLHYEILGEAAAQNLAK